MSRENVEIVRQLYRAWAQGEFWAHPEAFAPDVRSARVMSPDAEGVGLSGDWQGLDGLVENALLWLSAWNDLRVEPTEFLEAGDKVVVFTRQTATAKASGIPLDREFADVWEVREGKVVGVRFYWKRGDALKAAGLSE
jgi:ketosteroid isomerase-like protein